MFNVSSIVHDLSNLWFAPCCHDSYGQLLPRTWARTNAASQPPVTTYSYDAMGRQNGVGYSDGTPSLALTYNYVPGTSRIGGTSWANAPALNTSHTYDAHQRLTGIAVNNVPLIGCTLNDKNRFFDDH